MYREAALASVFAVHSESPQSTEKEFMRTSETFWSETEGPTINNTFFVHGYYAVERMERGQLVADLIRIENSIGEVVGTVRGMIDNFAVARNEVAGWVGRKL